MQRESFIFYNSFYKAISALPENEQLTMYKAIAERALFGIEPELACYTRAMYELILPQIQANEKKYLNGAKGGAPKGNQNARKNNQETTENNQNQPNVNVNENVNENVVYSGCTELQQPIFSFSEIEKYIFDNKLNVNAKVFFEYYQKQEWKTDKGEPITDLQKLLRLWSATEKTENKIVYKNGYSSVKNLGED